MEKKILLVVLALFPYSFLMSQDCGTVITEEQMKFMNEIEQVKGKSSGRSQLSIVKVPLKIHAIRPNNGGGGGFTESQLSSLFAKINSYYVNAGIEFFQFGEVNNIFSDTFYNLNSSNEGGVAVPNDVANVINVYFMNTLITNGQPLCGYTRFPPSSDRVFTTYSCALGGVTLEHELGHYFTLFHTHGTSNNGSTDELVNGSNCSSAGDRICDTPADPNLSGKVNAQCIYIGADRDANGQAFSPQVANIMSYAGSCRNIFTEGQYERIRNGFENGRNYLQVQSNDFSPGIFTFKRQTCKGGIIAFQATGSGATSWNWEFPGGVPSSSTEKNPKIKYTTSGKFNVKLTASASNGQTATVDKVNFISVTDPLDEALTGELSYSFDSSIPEAFKIANPDQSVTYSFSSYDRLGQNSGSIFVNNYNYVSDRSFDYDELIGPYLSNVGVKRYNITFDVSYSPRLGGLDGANIRPDAFDSLSLTFYGKCDSKPIQIWKQGGEELQTAPIQSSEFFPSSSQWKKISLDIVIQDEEFTQLSWINTSANGNNLYIDNISIQPDFSLNTPTNFRSTNVSTNGVTLRWDDNSTNELAFVIERSANEEPFLELVKLTKNTISFVDMDVQSNSKYKYRLYAEGIGKNKSITTSEISVDFFVTSIEDLVQLKIYPNPVSNTLYITNDENEGSLVEVFTIQGFLLRDIYVSKKSSAEIPFDELSQGVYFLRFEFPKKTIYSKIIKIK